MTTAHASSLPKRVRTASPGRIEFIGNHTDYNGGQVLGVALNLQVRVTAEARADDHLLFTSEGQAAAYAGTLGGVARQDGPLAWANYPLGVLHVLREAGYPLHTGFTLAFSSDLPAGAGLSSSAAIELATLEAVCALSGLQLDDRDKVLLAQRAENTFVGVPCGMLDQAVSCHGRRDHLVRIDCARTEFTTVPLPPGLHFWVFNTNHKHSLVDSLYARRHAECREALALLQPHAPGLAHLAHAPAAALDRLDADSVPARRARHVAGEHQRVLRCAAALARGDLGAVGDLLFESHESSRRLFENSIPELDTFVGLLAGLRGRGVVGARLTGGGFGGAVMALTTGDFTAQLAAAVLDGYRARHPQAEAPACLHVTTGDGTRRIA